MMVGRLLFTLVYTCLMGKFGIEPLAASLLLHLLMSSITLESTSCCVVSRTAPLLGVRQRLKSSGSIALATSLELVMHARVTNDLKVGSYFLNLAHAPVLVSKSHPVVQ